MNHAVPKRVRNCRRGPDYHTHREGSYVAAGAGVVVLALALMGTWTLGGSTWCWVGSLTPLLIFIGAAVIVVAMHHAGAPGGTPDPDGFALPSTRRCRLGPGEHVHPKAFFVTGAVVGTISFYLWFVMSGPEHRSGALLVGSWAALSAGVAVGGRHTSFLE